MPFPAPVFTKIGQGNRKTRPEIHLFMDVNEPISTKLTLVQWHNWVLSGAASPLFTVRRNILHEFNCLGATISTFLIHKNRNKKSYFFLNSYFMFGTDVVITRPRRRKLGCTSLGFLDNFL